MRINFSKKRKCILSILLVILGMVLLFNTNNNATPFVGKVFKPIRRGSSTTYYASAVSMLLIYCGFIFINRFGQNKLFDNVIKRIVATIIVMYLANPLNIFCIKIVKSMSKDLNSIYYNRDVNNTLYINNTDKGKKILNCTIELENCSEKQQEFYIEVEVPGWYKKYFTEEKLKAKEYDYKTDKKFILNSKEKKEVDLLFIANIKEIYINVSGSVNGFNFRLYNDKGQVEFVERK